MWSPSDARTHRKIPVLSRILERVLVKFLSPYIDGLSTSTLRFTIRSGLIELKDLQVKPEALDLLGFQGVKVGRGGIGHISLQVPWRSLFSGKLDIAIEHLRLEVHESLASAESMREWKSKAIDLRMEQLRDMVEQASALEAGIVIKEGLGVRIARKVLNNLSINILDVSTWLVTTTRPLACGLELAGLKVVSTDETFQEPTKNTDVVRNGPSMHKLLRVNNLGFRLSAAGSADLEGATYVIDPTSASIQLTHAPKEHLLKVHAELGVTEVNKVVLRFSQWHHTQVVLAAAAAKAALLQANLVDLETERAIYADSKASSNEYGTLYERHLTIERNISGGSDISFGDEDRARMMQLEAALPVRRLAHYRWLAHTTIQRRTRLDSKNSGPLWVGWLSCEDLCCSSSDPGVSTEHEENLEHEQEEEEEIRHLIQQNLSEVRKVEEVEPPDRVRMELKLHGFTFELIDDRHQGRTQQELLILELPDASMGVQVDNCTDSVGKELMTWEVSFDLGTWRALHAGKEVIFPKAASRRRSLVRQSSMAPMVPHEPPVQKGAAHSAKLLIKNKQEDNCSILSIHFTSSPLVVHLLPGTIGRIVEFFGQPEDLQAGMILLGAEESEVAARSLLEGLELVQKVKEQIPDRLHLDLTIAAPVVRAPVQDRGVLEANLGKICLLTSSPCDYDNLDFSIKLTDTMLSAESHRKERFNVIQPMPMTVQVQVTDSEEDRNVNVEVAADTLPLSLAPEALQILLFFPETINAILSEALPEKLQAAMEGPVGWTEQSHPCLRKSMSETLRTVSVSSNAVSSQMLLRSQAFIQGVDEVAGRTLSMRSNSKSLSMSTHTLLSEGGLGSATSGGAGIGNERTASAYISEQFGTAQNLHVTVRVCCNGVSLTVADSLVPLLRLHLELRSPGLVLEQQRFPQSMSIDVDTASLELQALSQLSGQWEPLIETCSFGLTVRQPSGAGGEASGTAVSAIGQSPLLLNLTPTNLQKLNRTIELITTKVAEAEVLHTTPPTPAVSDARHKYRVVNICGHELELQFLTHNSVPHNMVTVPPTGSDYGPLDDDILRECVTAVVVRMPGGEDSRILQLDMDGAVIIPGCRAVAELRTELGGGGHSHRLLLIAPPLRLHNVTSIPLHVRFHDASKHSELDVVLDPKMVCDAAMLGSTPPGQRKASRAVRDEEQDWAKEGLAACNTLPPNALCSVPERAIICGAGGDFNMAHTWLSARPAGLDTPFSEPVEVPAVLGSTRVAIHCVGSDSQGMVHVECKATSRGVGLAAHVVVTTVELRPPVVVLNALPIGTLHIMYAQHQHPGPFPRVWHEVAVAKFNSLDLHNISSAAPGNSVSLRARLSEDAPWSRPITFRWEQLEKPETLQVQQEPDGAVVAVLVEPVDQFKLRFSCPFWLVDCSGLERPYSLKVHHRRSPLPNEAGLVLLPRNCLEEDVNLVLCSQDGTSPTSTLRTRMPPNWTTLPWDAGNQPLILCIESETISPSDVFGAECRAMILRPRLLLTNASTEDIEISHSNATLVLAPDQSQELHWHVERGTDEQPPQTELRFRPVGTQPPRRWSSTVVCSDVAAGSTPFLLLAAEKSDAATVDVWSVEVAPARGALAVSFKRGSVFVAANNVTPLQQGHGRKAEMLVRPLSSSISPSRDVSHLLPVPPGAEVPFGWIDPFRSQERGIEVVVNGYGYYIDDVRHTERKPVGNGDWIIRVQRQGEKTLVSLEEAHKRALDHDGFLRLDIRLSQVGVSLIQEAPQMREVLYVHLAPVDIMYEDTDIDAHKLTLAVKHAQVDCQLPGRLDDDLPRAQRKATGARWRPPVVLRNFDRQRPFLALSLERCATSSGDIVLPRACIELDYLDVHIDDDWLEAVVAWSNETDSNSLQEQQLLTKEQVIARAGQSIIKHYKPPSLPRVVQVESLQISDVKVVIWCRLKLSIMNFLPDYVLTAVRAVSASSYFTLSGASVTLPDKTFPAHRGSLEDFLDALKDEYGRDVFKHIFSLLKKSSLLNMPRSGMRIGSAATGVIYSGFHRGLHRAKTIAEEIRPLVLNPEFVSMNSLTQTASQAPILSGTGRTLYLVRTFACGARRRRQQRAGPSRRQRPPRLLLAAVSGLRPWSDFEAAVFRQLGRQLCSSAHEVLQLTRADHRCVVLLFYADKLLVACIETSGALGRVPGDEVRLPPASEADPDPATFFNQHFAQAFCPLNEVEALECASVRHPPIGVRAFRFSELRTVHREGLDSVMRLEDKAGNTHALVLPSGHVSADVRQAIADGLSTVAGYSHGLANWSALRSVLYAERCCPKVTARKAPEPRRSWSTFQL